MKGNRKTLSQGVDPSVNSSHLSKKNVRLTLPVWTDIYTSELVKRLLAPSPPFLKFS